MEKENNLKEDFNNKKAEKNNFHRPLRVNLLSTEDLDNFIDNLHKPNFLGSVHLNRKQNLKKNSIEEQLINSVGTNKLSESIKNTLFNPITKILILAWIVFNLFWIIFVYLL
ncbi:MAG: hypothetical protein BAJALOKI2v1_30097 [Promethearchaeota archaeon]|nr:MAG: hypothetical protein BAJALOKI2v1_30097 [Candidatus Lokiarchaeota archaeon]